MFALEYVNIEKREQQKMYLRNHKIHTNNAHIFVHYYEEEMMLNFRLVFGYQKN